MSKSTIFEIGPVDFAHFSSPSPFKWLENRKNMSHLEKERPQGFEVSALNIFKTSLSKTVSHRLIEAKIECHFLIIGSKNRINI